ncbi:hypothetical protein BDAP_002783 [Binucleata daphniae]
MSKNLCKLTYNKNLYNAAHLQNLYNANNNKMDHIGPITARNLESRINKSNYDGMIISGENCGRCTKENITKMVDAWKESKTHNANLIEDFDEYGLDIIFDNNGIFYITMTYGKSTNKNTEENV